MADLMEMARELGEALGRTSEYREFRRAMRAADDDRDVVRLQNELRALEERIGEAIHRGEDVPEEVKGEYERLVGELQASPVYQRLVAAQVNFEKVLARVNRRIAEAMAGVGESRIVLPS